jgi:hypothetical protein
MKTIGIVIDDWKLSIFKHHLTEAGYKFTFHKGISFGTLILRVQARFASDVAPAVQAADAECASIKNKQNLIRACIRQSKALGAFAFRAEMKKP